VGTQILSPDPILVGPTTRPPSVRALQLSLRWLPSTSVAVSQCGSEHRRRGSLSSLARKRDRAPAVRLLSLRWLPPTSSARPDPRKAGTEGSPAPPLRAALPWRLAPSPPPGHAQARARAPCHGICDLPSPASSPSPPPPRARGPAAPLGSAVRASLYSAVRARSPLLGRASSAPAALPAQASARSARVMVCGVDFRGRR